MPRYVIITEVNPFKDTAEFYALAAEKGVRLVGPNCPGVISPGKSNVGIIPADITGPGKIGLVSKSGTLTYQMMYELRDFGFSTCVGIGGDRSEEHTSELQSRGHLVCRLLLEKKKETMVG